MSTTRDLLHNMYSQRGTSTSWSTLRNEEYQEDDIWGTLNHIREFDPINTSNGNHHTIKSSSSSSSLIPKSEKVKQSSNSIWTKNGVKKESNNNTINVVSWSGSNDYRSSRRIVNAKSWDNDDDDDEEIDDSDGGSMVPPHEWIARKIARSGMSSFSVHEGVGRTLKGRDLSNVRTAVLTKTGFLE